MVVTMVMVTAPIVMAEERIHTPGKRGPSWRYCNTGGASAGVRHRPTRKQGLQGLRFAPGGAGRRVDCPVSAGLCVKAGEWERCEPRCVPGLQVCTRPHENGQGRKLNAGAGLQPIRWLCCRNRPTSLCAPSDASDTAPRNSLYACACARLAESYDNLCPMRQTVRKGSWADFCNPASESPANPRQH